MPLDFGPVIGRIREAGGEATLTGAEMLKAKSQERTPVETGNLRAEHDARPAGPMRAEVYVPGPYARYQHFGLDFRHEEGQALFLETAVMADSGEVLSVVARVLQGAING